MATFQHQGARARPKPIFNRYTMCVAVWDMPQALLCYGTAACPVPLGPDAVPSGMTHTIHVVHASRHGASSMVVLRRRQHSLLACGKREQLLALMGMAHHNITRTNDFLT